MRHISKEVGRTPCMHFVRTHNAAACHGVWHVRGVLKARLSVPPTFRSPAMFTHAMWTIPPPCHAARLRSCLCSSALTKFPRHTSWVRRSGMTSIMCCSSVGGTGCWKSLPALCRVHLSVTL